MSGAVPPRPRAPALPDCPALRVLPTEAFDAELGPWYVGRPYHLAVADVFKQTGALMIGVIQFGERNYLCLNPSDYEIRVSSRPPPPPVSRC